MADGSRLMASGMVLVALGALSVSRQPLAVGQQPCSTPRAAQWAATRDSLWPLIVHRDRDEAWAHLDPAGLPGSSATWCNPLQADSEAVRAGRTLFVQLCANCHGDQGKGDGPLAVQSSVTPFDFTRAEFAGTREPPGPGVLYAILTRGIEGTMMRNFGDDLGGWERLAVIAYVTQLPGRAAISNSHAWADSLRARRRP
jgi:Cytochrome C oxidase, cbb3-type, subunit III